MSIANAVAALNGFKRRRVIKDYAVIGVMAATAYMEPMFTKDLDVIVLVDTDDDYLAAFQSIANESDGQRRNASSPRSGSGATVYIDHYAVVP